MATLSTSPLLTPPGLGPLLAPAVQQLFDFHQRLAEPPVTPPSTLTAAAVADEESDARRGPPPGLSLRRPRQPPPPPTKSPRGVGEDLARSCVLSLGLGLGFGTPPTVGEGDEGVFRTSAAGLPPPGLSFPKFSKQHGPQHLVGGVHDDLSTEAGSPTASTAGFLSVGAASPAASGSPLGFAPSADASGWLPGAITVEALRAALLGVGGWAEDTPLEFQVGGEVAPGLHGSLLHGYPHLPPGMAADPPRAHLSFPPPSAAATSAPFLAVPPPTGQRVLCSGWSVPTADARIVPLLGSSPLLSLPPPRTHATTPAPSAAGAAPPAPSADAATRGRPPTGSSRPLLSVPPPAGGHLASMVPPPSLDQSLQWLWQTRQLTQHCPPMPGAWLGTAEAVTAFGQLHDMHAAHLDADDYLAKVPEMHFAAVNSKKTNRQQGW